MTDEVNEMSAASRDSHADAWAVEHGGSIVYVAIRANDAQEWAGNGPVDVVPLYRQAPPTDSELSMDETLTDAEREAVAEACDEGRWIPDDYHHIHTLRSLLARLSSCRICHGTGRVTVRMGSEPCERCK